ncbi:MAG TPA: hypothetical protein IGS52_20615 [Oscillatoriaceae cyanobacterium M33_DOE_052]|uniref:Uncharacterized protein n=1 Tax=Planktothricoides sp. SpSt-374 TaxID=2282167 RepID=A0A7C3VPX9_9CYAN|nr:hypothetical protein [Oscillatoriaceae cyanobacterium M33_DOE_052]
MFLNQLPKIAKQKLEPMLVGGFLLAAASLMLFSLSEPTARVRPVNPALFCEEMVLPKAQLSGEQLAKLLTVPEPAARTKVQEILKQPYCRLPSLSVRVGAITDRDAYPLAFDPQTWLVVLYEGENYVGYGFKRF